MASTSGRPSSPNRRRRSPPPPAAGDPGVLRADVALAREIVLALENGEVHTLKKFQKGLMKQNSSLHETVAAVMPPSVADALLHKAAVRGLLEMCRYLSKDLGLDVNGTIESGATPLISAVDGIGSANSSHKKKEYQKVVELLLRRGASPMISKPDGFSPIHAATIRDSLEIAKILLDNGADVNAMCLNGTVLHIAAESGTSSEVVKHLLDRGANANTKNASGFTALHVAARKDSHAIAVLLLNSNAEVDATCNDGTPLHIATESGASLAFVELLLCKGADPNITNKSGLAALHYATLRDDCDVATLLLSKGADVDAACENETALHIAARRGSQKMLSLLLECDASANLCDKMDQKAIEVAATKGHRKCVEVLFPLTERIKDYQTWSIDGVMEDAKNRAVA